MDFYWFGYKGGKNDNPPFLIVDRETQLSLNKAILQKSRALFGSAALCLFAGRSLLGRNHDPQQQVNQNARYAARDERDDHTQPEPECTDAEKLGQSATNTGQHPVTA